jgi:Cdc6-like AAA superfamily ATPase
MAVPTDPRLIAFLDPDSPEIFHSVATPTAMWEPDPFDVETIHREAREAFARLLSRATREPQPSSGALLVLLGDAGSGKTHLMRAFRNHSHTGANGYCGYLQLNTEVNNYPRYILNNLIDSLEQPYTPASNDTGLTRLAGALLECVPDLSADDREKFREGHGEAVGLVEEYADRLQSLDRFRTCDLGLMRVLLYCERNDFRVRSRALMWLRCLNLTPRDAKWIGDAVPRADDADPNAMVRHLAQLMRVVHNAPLVLLVDQMEEMERQSDNDRRFVRVVDALTTFTDQNSNVVVVLACLADYFSVNSERLSRAKIDRLMNDPKPIRLNGNCRIEDIRGIAATRLRFLYDESEIDSEREPLFPFTAGDLDGLAGTSPRYVLLYLQEHHRRCIAEGRWLAPSAPPPPPAPPATGLDGLWNDFVNTFEYAAPDEEPQFAAVLASAIRNIAAELPEGNVYGSPDADEHCIELELTRPDGDVAKTLVAVCNMNARGGGLLNQLRDVRKRADTTPVSIVRTTDFPRSGQALDLIGEMVKNQGYTVVVQDTDWRRMMAFAAFREKYKAAAGFDAWQRDAKPLGELASLQKLLRLKELKPRHRQATPAEPAEVPPAPRPSPAAAAPPAPKPTKAEETVRLVAEKINGGDTTGFAPKPVTFDAIEFTRHAAFLGGAGSGKTTAALNIIEQLLAQGVPAILIDRKGDLSRYADPAAWERPLSHESRTAARAKLRAMLDVAVYTPGDDRGRPLALPLVPPGFDQLAEGDRERFARYAAAGLGSMMSMKTSHADQVQRVILAKAIETLSAMPGESIDLANLRALIADRHTALMARLGDSFQEAYFSRLAERLQTLALSNAFLFKGGETLDVESLLGAGSSAKPGRVKLSVVNTKFLGSDEAVQFWVSQFLIAVARFCTRHPMPRLQAVLMFDEADMYLPAVGKPATKEPMEDLLRRARSAGVGIFLATQSPGDLDYKCRENLLTWFVGRIGQDTAIEKLKPLMTGRPGVADKLGEQGQGHFTLVRDGGGIVEMKSFESLLKTEQLSEAEILDLARRAAP